MTSIMKQMFLWVAAGALLVLAACQQKKSGNPDIITTDYEAPKPVSPISQDAMSERTSVEWIEGRMYDVVVSRTPVDSLPMVTDEIGQKFIDNVIRVKVLRADGTVFFERPFTKRSFLSWLDKDYKKSAVLEGIRFLKANHAGLEFSAWLNFPKSGDDEAVELRMTISRNGEVGIQPYNENDREDLEILEEKRY